MRRGGQKGRRRLPKKTGLPKRKEGRTVGRIENWSPAVEGEAREREEGEQGEKKKKKERKFVHEILGQDREMELQSVRVQKEVDKEDGEEGEVREAYRVVQGGGEIPLTGLGRRRQDRVEGRAGELDQQRIHIHYSTPIVSQVTRLESCCKTIHQCQTHHGFTSPNMD